MNRLPALVALLFTMGCGASRPNARPAEVPTSDCHCDDDEAAQWLPENEAAPKSAIAYVKLSDWAPPPQVRDVEAQVPPRGDAPPTFTEFPKLTLDHEIGATRALLAGTVYVRPSRARKGRR